MADKDFVIIDSAREEEQKKVLEQIVADNVCPFCPENLKKYHKKPIIKDGKYWTLTFNQWPYENTKHHFLAIHKTHIEHINDLLPEASQELFELFQYASKENNMPGGAFLMRFGSNPEYGTYGNSVLHLHAHLIEPDLENQKGEAIRFKIGDPKNRKNK